MVQKSVSPTGTNLPLYIPELLCSRISQNHCLEARDDGFPLGGPLQTSLPCLPSSCLENGSELSIVSLAYVPGGQDAS